MNRKILIAFLTFVFVVPAVLAAPAATNEKAGSSAPAEPAAVPAAPVVSAAAPAVSPAPAPAASIAAPAAAESVSASVETPAFKTLFSPAADAQSVVYEVKPGDTLTAIAKKHQTTAGVIKRVNGLTKDRLRPAQKLKIPTCKFSLVVDKSQNTLLLKGDETILKTYRVSTGENNGTPVGVFKITDKLKDPVWYKEEKNGASYKIPAGSPKNQLGTRWIGLDKPGYGIHGTIEPEKLGTQCTQGCVRMRNDEVEELFEIVPSGTEVTIVD